MQPEQPQQPPPAPGQPGHDPYGFIVDPAKPPRKPLLKVGNSLASRLLVILGIIFVLIILLVVIKNLAGSSEKVDRTSMINVVADQQELIHLSTGGVTDAVSQNTKNFAITTELSVTSEQSQLISYLKSHNIKGTTAELDSRQSASIDSQLNNAVSSSTFDSTFSSVMQNGLAVYQKDLKTAYNLNLGPNARALLNADYTGAGLLAKQLSAPAS